MNIDQWIKTSERLPYHGQRVWVLFASGFEYAAIYTGDIGSGGFTLFHSERPEIEFREQPTRWRERE